MTYRYWLVNFSADTTETGCTTSTAYIRTTWGADSNYCATEMLRDFCRQPFGREVEYVQGCGPCLNWVISDSTHEQWIEAPRTKWGRTLRMTVTWEKNGKFVISQQDENPTGPPVPTYDDLARENAELRERLAHPTEDDRGS